MRPKLEGARMARLSAADRAWVERLAKRLRRRRDGAPAALAEVLPEITTALGAARGVAFGYRPAGTGAEQDYLHLAGFPRRAAVEAGLARLLRGPAPFAPLVPAPAEANVALRVARLRGRARAGWAPLVALLGRGLPPDATVNVVAGDPTSMSRSRPSGARTSP
jgi:hypothetical protein